MASSSSKSTLASVLAAPFVAPALFAGAAAVVAVAARARQQAPAQPKLRLLYWPARGIMETARMMCGIAGVDVSDERLGGAPEGAVCEANLGRMVSFGAAESEKSSGNGGRGALLNSPER